MSQKFNFRIRRFFLCFVLRLFFLVVYIVHTHEIALNWWIQVVRILYTKNYRDKNFKLYTEMETNNRPSSLVSHQKLGKAENFKSSTSSIHLNACMPQVNRFCCSTEKVESSSSFSFSFVFIYDRPYDMIVLHARREREIENETVQESRHTNEKLRTPSTHPIVYNTFIK